MINNLNDAMAWGLLPVVLVAAGLSLRQTGAIAAAYPGVWGYRLWRDGGYVVGALLTGFVADLAGVASAIWTVGALTFVSGVIILVWMRPVPRGNSEV